MMNMTIKQHWYCITHPALAKIVYPDKWKAFVEPLVRRRYIESGSELVDKVFFKVYRWFRKVDVQNIENWRHDVCDHLGPIDTLGSSGTDGKWTGTFHCEWESQYWFQVGRVRVLRLDYDKPLVRIFILKEGSNG